MKNQKIALYFPLSSYWASGIVRFAFTKTSESLSGCLLCWLYNLN